MKGFTVVAAFISTVCLPIIRAWITMAVGFLRGPQTYIVACAWMIFARFLVGVVKVPGCTFFSQVSSAHKMHTASLKTTFIPDFCRV